MTKRYIVTEPELVAYTTRVYKNLTEVSNTCTESTSMVDVFRAMAVPSQLVCHISNGSVYPASSGTLAMNKTGNETGTAMFVDGTGRVSTGVFPWSDWQSPGYSNPNLLINWDFRNPINQRGQSRYTEYGHTIDHLQISGSANSALTLSDGGIVLTNANLAQSEDNYGTMLLFVAKCTSGMAGRIVTASIAYENNIGVKSCFLQGAKGSEILDDSNIMLSSVKGIAKVKLKILDNTEYIELRIGRASVNYGTGEINVKLVAIKLELGTVSTLVADLLNPTPYEYELLRCLQYDLDGNYLGAVAASNPNLLINWDFRNPVNQRGQNEYTGDEYSGHEYTIDMWRSASNGGGKTVAITSEGLRLSHEGSGLFDFMQKLEHGVEGYVTFSAKIDGQIYSITFTLHRLGATTFGPIQFYSDSIECVLRVSNKTVNIQAVKLEVGTVSTLALDLMQPSNYAAELRKCQRYYEKGIVNATIASKENYATTGTFTNSIACKEKRLPPTYTIGDAWVPGFYGIEEINQRAFSVNDIYTYDSQKTEFYLVINKQIMGEDKFYNMLGRTIVFTYEANAEL